MSLDGFVTGPGPSWEHGLGMGGERLHDWAMSARTAADAALLDEITAATGAVLIGRRTFDVVDGPNGWNDERGYGGDRGQAGAPPVFVVTSSPPASEVLSWTVWAPAGTSTVNAWSHETAVDPTVPPSTETT